MNVSVNTLRAGAARLAGCAAILSLFGLSAAAQKPEARILAPVDNTARVTLAGSHPAARLQNATDAGRMSGMMPLQGVSLAFSRSAAQETALEALIAAQQDPASPKYHQWLSPDEFAAQFGMADADLAKVQSWLQGQGFTIDEVARNKSIIRFSGNIAQIEAAFGTEMHYYNVGAQGQATERHFAPANDLSVPAAFSGAVLTVANLSDFRPRSHMKMAANGKYTSGQTGSHFVTPKDVATIYDVNAAYNAGWTGAGQTIAVIGQSEVVSGDITSFQTAAGTPIRAFNRFLTTGTATVLSGDESESDLDLEYTGAIARGATIDFVYTGCTPAVGTTPLTCNSGAFDALGYAVMNKIAPIISISYGECEPALGNNPIAQAPFNGLGAYTYYNNFAQQAAAQGQSIVSAAGDQGSTDCYGISFTGFTTAQEANLAVDWPASSQYVTGMGGTEYLAADVTSTSSTYWLSNSVDTGIDAVGTALSYIPEQAWNDDAAASGLSSGGGGISVLTPRPTWQGGSAIPAGIVSSNRLVPDISLASSPNNAGYLYCSSDTSTGITGSCSFGFRDSGDSFFTIAGGTSFAAPIFSGMLAIIAQSKGVTTGMGLINPTLYTLAATPATYASAFHDITAGNNGCTVGTTYAVAFNSNGSVSQTGPACASNGQYAATTGYDLATGLGSVDLNNLLTAWPGTAATAPAKFTLSAAAATITAGSSGTATITITPSGGYTGTVNMSFTSNPLVNYACFSSGSGTVTGTSAATATITINTSTLSTASSVCPTGAQALSQGGGKVASVEAPAQPGRHVPGELPAGIAAAGLLAIGFMGRRSRRLRGLIAVAVLAIAGFGLAGCGSGASGTGVVGGGGGTTTPPPTGATAAKGTYTITVTGEDSVTGLQASTTFSLTLQ